MNELQIEAMERKLQEMQEQLKAMKEECASGTFPAMLPDEGEYFLSQEKFVVEHLSWSGGMSAKQDRDQNVFPSQEIAEAYGDAFRVMLELRRCEGAGHYSEYNDEGYGYACCIDSVVAYTPECYEAFSIVPPFPTEELAQAAIDSVGKERIVAAMQLLANARAS